MSFSRRKIWLPLLALLLVGTIASPVSAQRRRFPASAAPAMVNPRLFVTPVNPNFPFTSPQTSQQFLFNSAVANSSRVLGVNAGGAPILLPPDVRAFNYGINPYVPLVAAGNYYTPSPTTSLYPTYPGNGSSPYALSTVAPPSSYPLGSTLSTSPYGGYSLSTAGGAGYGGYGGYENPITAYGQYQQMKEQASLMREVVRQAKFDTYRKQVEYEQWYERMRMTSSQMRNKEIATDLDIARRSATPPRSTRASR